MTASLSIKTHESPLSLPSPEVVTPQIKITNIRISLAVPVQPRTPNPETAQVLKEIERGEGIVRYSSLGELISDCERFAEAPDS
ncbi:MAG: hypothetical protein OXG43_05730 [Chloroflexi bacterium]|nr:hypothetical protein [Chloroflexota bacterium]